MKTIIGLILAFFLTVGDQSPRFVSGTVYDEFGNTIEGVTVSTKNSYNSVQSDINGFYQIEIKQDVNTLIFKHPEFKTKKINVGKRKIVDVVLEHIVEKKEVIVDMEFEEDLMMAEPAMIRSMQKSRSTSGAGYRMPSPYESRPPFNTENYATIHENEFRKVTDAPLSTFSIDVDAASYSNVRRFLNNGQLPPKDAVRVEEMINYFSYDYDLPKGSDPFSINTTLTQTPWNEDHLLVQIGLQGEKIDIEDLPGSNLVFLVDVSGSMQAANKLPLLKSSMKMLTNELRGEDKVSMVVYAGAAGLVLPPTRGDDKRKIIEALDKLEAGGSTAGGAGIKLAYKIAQENFIEGGNNRIILATDGDFNIGESSDAGMERLIEEKRKSGVFLTVLGYGMGNYKDSKMEILADKGNGNYAYIDNIREAKKVLVNEFGGTLHTIAKDVKIQVEFNPSHVQAYRLIGYENRKLNNEDFNNDQKDAGELGSGHTVTALYEIIPAGVKSDFMKNVDPLKYQSDQDMKSGFENELLTVKFRYKDPNGSKSKLITKTVEHEIVKSDKNIEWAAAVAGFGMLLRESEFKGDLNYDKVLALAKSSKGHDPNGYRGEFIGLVDIASRMARNN